MAYRLRVAPVRSASRLAGAANINQLAEAHDVDGRIVHVDEYETAATLVARNHNVAWADGDPGPPDGGDVAEVGDTTDDDEAICGAEMSDGSICERPAGECPYH